MEMGRKEIARQLVLCLSFLTSVDAGKGHLNEVTLTANQSVLASLKN